MTTFTRAEMEREFEAYQERGRIAGRDRRLEPVGGPVHRGRRLRRAPLRPLRGPRGDPGVDHLDDDAVPQRPVHVFPIEWAMFDEDRGWIVCEVQNRLNDLGDGEIYQAANLTKLHYAGDGHVELRGGRLQPRGDGRRRQGLARQATGAQARLT